MNPKYTSVFFLVIVMLCVLFLGQNEAIFSTNYVGIIIQTFSALLMIWARITFGLRSFHGAANTTKGELVTKGPYKWLRHPIYASLIYFFWAGVLSHISVETIAAVIIITAGLIGRFLLEEKFLLVAYPQYVTYAAQTKRIIPFVA